MTTKKENRRNNGMANVIAAQKRSNNKAATTAAPVVPAAAVSAEPTTTVVELDASPVNSAPAAPAAPEAPAEPAAPAATETPEVVPEDTKAATESHEVAETPEVPETPETPAVPEFTIEQELAFIATGLKTLLGVKGDVPLTPEGLATLGLRTARQALMALLADEEVVAGIRAKKDEVLNKAKALVPTVPTGKKERQQEPELADEAHTWASRMR